MSRIDKIRISGIRSFNPDQVQEIQFTPPLTLILGQNGCGKTTIIESLKYITTGEMPPGCGKGASFIHDPKIMREMVVRGQIRLRVTSSAKEKVEFVRSMEVTQKARTLEFKSVDQTITRVGADGRKRQVSSKCVDFQQEVINTIGVSKPILENVIFCHQEDSCWPLDESKRVKDKFDAIFNATRYIKCLESMRKLRADKKKEVKNMQETLASLKDMKEEADRKKNDLATQQDQLGNIKDEQKEIMEQKKPVHKRILEIEEVENSLAEVQKELGSKESRITMLQANNTQDVSEQSHQVECSDEELHRRIKEYQSTLSLKKNEIERVERTISEAERELRLLACKETEEQKRLAKLEAEQEQQQERVERRDRKMGDVVRGGTIPGMQAYAGQEQYTEAEAEAVLGCVTEHITRQEEQLEARVGDMMEDERSLQTSLDNLRSREAALTQEVRGLEARITGLDAQLRRGTLELVTQRRDVQRFDAKQITAEMGQVKELLQSKEEAMDEQQMSSRIDELKSKRTVVAGQVDDLKKQVAYMNKQAAARNELDLHTASVEEHTSKITQLLRKNKDALDCLQLGNATEENIKAQFDKVTRKVQNAVSASKSDLDKAKESRAKNQVLVDSLRKQMEEKEKEIKSLEQRISDVCPNVPLEEALARKKTQLEGLQRESGELESTQTVMQRYVQKLTVEDACPLCHRDFATKFENESLRDELRGRITNLPMRLASAKTRCSVTEKQYNTLLQLQPFREQLQQAQARLRSIQSDVARPLSEIATLNGEVDGYEMSLSFNESEERMCHTVQGDVIIVDSQARSRTLLKAKCEDLRRRLGDQGGSESLDSATERLTALEEEWKSINGAVEEQQGQYFKYKDELVELRNRHTRLAQREIEMKTKQQAVDKKQEEVTRFEKEKAAELSNKAEKSKLLAPAKQAVQQEQSKKDAASAKRVAFGKHENTKLDALREILRPLATLQANITAYLSSSSSTKLQHSRDAVDKLKREAQDKQDVKKQHGDKLRALEKELVDQKDYERSLNTENKVRQRKREIGDLREAVSILQKKIATSGQQSLTEEKGKLIRSYRDLEGKFNSANGRAEEVKKCIDVLEIDLRSPKFREAVRKYFSKMLQIKVTDKACEDLNRYYRALDTSVMRFHAEKMKTINSIIRQLWNSTYRGNDIDMIQIKTDDNESKGADHKRTYHYRVVMIRQGVELDMRGRCSAGQKVLASLIIRMALAETFSKNCGILALDEPTTNLDRENIDSLIMALIDIVRKRSVQRNFQLIVITHDDDFMRGLTRSDNIRDYYHVYRDGNGASCIKKISVDMLGR